MARHLPDYLRDHYKTFSRGETDTSVKFVVSFQKSMYCVTSAAIHGLAPHSWDTTIPEERAKNRAHYEAFVDRLINSGSRLTAVQPV